MKTLQQFMTEAYDADVMGSSQIRKTGQRGEIGRDRRKSEPEKRRVKAIGGGKTAPAKSYKDRKDIGSQRQASTREQQPTKERGSAALSPKEAQRKAYLERKAREKGGTSAGTSKDKEAAARKLLSKKEPAKKVERTPHKASGYNRTERQKIQRTGERLRQDMIKGKEKSASHYSLNK